MLKICYSENAKESGHFRNLAVGGKYLNGFWDTGSSVNRTLLPQDADQWWALVNTGKDLRVPQKTRDFLTR
jgi:hypothetical protein